MLASFSPTRHISIFLGAGCELRRADSEDCPFRNCALTRTKNVRYVQSGKLSFLKKLGF